MECPACNGYGTADGKPCGTHARDFGAQAPGPCPTCKGTGDAPHRLSDAPSSPGLAATPPERSAEGAR